MSAPIPTTRSASTDSLRLNVRVQNAMDGRAQFAVGEKVGIDVPAGAARMLVD